jgi:hypothetical protein
VPGPPAISCIWKQEEKHDGNHASPWPTIRSGWTERRDPMSLETSAPGVFAAGDIRAGAHEPGGVSGG